MDLKILKKNNKEFCYIKKTLELLNCTMLNNRFGQS